MSAEKTVVMRRFVAMLVGATALVAAPGTAQAAPSIESVKYVTVYDPPGGGTPIRRETPGRATSDASSGLGATPLNVDSDSLNELSATVSLSLDASGLAVTGRLQIDRLDFAALSPEKLPVRVEAIAVLKQVRNGETERKHVALGYDARESDAPGKFWVDLGSCSTPDCKATPTPCIDPCEGTKTTLGVNVVKPGASLKLVGELAGYAPDGGHQDATRAELDFSPVPGNSSPLVLTIWGTNTKTSDLPDAPVETLTHLSMNGNKDATKAVAHVCRLSGESYKPKQVFDTACDAAGYTDRRYDSRIVHATIDKLPRDIGSGEDLTVSVADNDRGAVGGKQTIEYRAIEKVGHIHVTDDAVTWSDDGKRRAAHRVYDLVDVPRWVDLHLVDESEAAAGNAPAPDQTVIYDAGGQLTSIDVDSTEHEDGKLVKREDLHVETVPTHLTVVAGETKDETVLPGAKEPGFDRTTRQSVGLIEASSPIGVIEYTTADGETTAAPPADIGDAYVYTNKPEEGSQFVKLRLLGVTRGNFTIGRHVHLDPWESEDQEEPEEEAGTDLLAVDATLTPMPFRTLAEDGGRVFDVRVSKLPGDVELTLEPEKGRIDYRAPFGERVDLITVNAKDPDTLFKRATTLEVSLMGVPGDVEVNYPSESNSELNLKVDQGQIDRLELRALGEGDRVPEGVISPDDDGMIMRDLEEGVEGVDESDPCQPDCYVMYARARGLRQVKYAKTEVDRDDVTEQLIDRKEFALDLTSGRNFVVDIEQTGEIKKYTYVDKSQCDSEVVGKRVERTRASIMNLPPSTTLTHDKRKSFGMRECRQNATEDYKDMKKDVTDIRYSSAGSAPELNFLLEDGSTDMRLSLLDLPTKLRFCRAGVGHECLPTIGQTYGTGMGSLTVDANDYFTILNLVDCDGRFDSNGKCETANARVVDLRLKRMDFWGDLDGGIKEGTNGDVYFNTADYDYGAPTWNGVPWDNGPATGDSQPLADPGRGEHARIKIPKADLTMVPGFYARGAHIYWDWIADDEIEDWGEPRGTGGIVYCPLHTHWEVDAGWAGWVDVHQDWCTAGAANG